MPGGDVRRTRTGRPRRVRMARSKHVYVGSTRTNRRESSQGGRSWLLTPHPPAPRARCIRSLLGLVEAVAFLVVLAGLAAGEFLRDHAKPILVASLGVSMLVPPFRAHDKST